MRAWVALAAQAARTAHELGTPLSSIAVAAGELSAALASDPLLERYRPDITTIESQLDACRNALYGLKEENPLAEHDVVSLNEWLPQFFYQWRLSHPATRLEAHMVVEDIACEGAVLLGQVLTIVLDNAARASEVVEVNAVAAKGGFKVTIDDHGEGLPAGLLDSIGSAPVSSRSGGRGWGLFLAFTAVEARGGKIRLTGRPEGGTRVAVDWPLAAAYNAEQQPSNSLS